MAEFKGERFWVACDAVVFTVLKGEFKILLIKRKHAPFAGKFALPGGMVTIDENLEDAAERELEEETGVKDIFLKQIKAYGKVGRDPRGRVLSVAFLALIDGEKVKLHATTDAALAKWQGVYDLPELAFDHDKIISDALEQLRFDLQNSNIAFQIMPEKFTMSELQATYEAVLGKKLDKRNFWKKIKELGILKELRETRMQGAHRPARLYSFKHSKLKNS